jgi:hypothetical protein
LEVLLHGDITPVIRDETGEGELDMAIIKEIGTRSSKFPKGSEVSHEVPKSSVVKSCKT